MGRAESTLWAVTVAPLVSMPWTVYQLISGDRRNVVVWALLIVLIAVFAVGVTGLIRLRQRRS
jgi:hypothetical protein